MTGTRLGSSTAVAIAGLLLTLSAQAAPTLGDQAISGMKLQLTAPRILAQGYDQSPPAQRAPEPYSPPQPSGPYSQPMPGAYPPAAPEYAPAPYGAPPPAYPMQYYYPPVDMRPATLEYDSSKPIPPGYHLESHARKGFIISGSIIFGISYFVAIAVAGNSTEGPSYGNDSSSETRVPFSPGLLYVPVLGPWLALGTVKDYGDTCNNSYYNSSCSDNSTTASVWRALLVIGGLTQAWGTGFFILGLASRSHQLVLNDNVRAQVVPVRIGNSGQGLALVGTFGGL
jgi:hypothetical protein